MRNRVVALAGFLAITCVPLGAGQAPVRPPAAADHGAVVTKYCVTCHNERAKTGGLSLDKVDIAAPVAAADVWERSSARCASA